MRWPSQAWVLTYKSMLICVREPRTAVPSLLSSLLAPLTKLK